MLVSTYEEVSSSCILSDRAQQGATSPSIGSSPSKKDTASQPQTPLEKLLLNAGPIREDGSDKFFGMENV
jgi:ubiquitin carboxyl-terminal hydrolase 9/13